MSPDNRRISTEEEFLKLFKEGRELFDDGKVEEAKRTLEDAYRLSPSSEGVENLLGMIYFSIGDFPKAETIYKKLLKRNPNNLTLRVNLGLIYFKTEKYFNAIRELNEALNIKPNYDKAHNYLGLVYAELGKYKTAREEFLRAGSRSMARKMESIIAGVVQPDFYKKKQQKEKENQDQSNHEIQIGDLTLDPELKEMLSDFEKGDKISESKDKSKVEHIRLDLDKDGLVEAKSSDEKRPAKEGKTETQREKKAEKEDAAGRSEFAITDNNNLEIIFSGHTFARSGGIVAAEGNLDFETTKKSHKGKQSKDDLGGEGNPIMKIKGNGKVLISPGDRRITIFTIDSEEVFYVNESSILAFQSGISWENGSIKLLKDDVLDILQIKGKGDFAVLSRTNPVVKEIVEGSPFKVKIGTFIGWQGKIIPKVVNISQKKDESKAVDIPFIEFAGKGKVIIE
ncbi:MAG: tetratricopeptide repeat protein [Deltaproteobacteria bacterium]|uniref:Tetratricopeptide repeat protein n=1 Tax=Candidatus Zymogenus saltonus TaxID=2844893 RepID=A0A9D8KD03_9DELT|nr:tetratricopeptide repeat protein [Candidatus Zymogenus saltonus]